MKWTLHVFAALLLLTIALLTLARRDFSGAWIAFASDRGGSDRLYLMTGDGGSVQQITPEHICARGANWSPDGEWIAFADFCAGRHEIMLMRPGGSQPRPITEIQRSTAGEWSPDSQRMAVMRRRNDVLGLYLVEAAGEGERFLGEEYHIIEWSPDSEWLYVTPLYTREMGLARIHVASGRVEQVLDGANRTIWMSWSPDGDEIMVALEHNLALMRPDGSEMTLLPVNLLSQGFRAPRWSPDGEWVVFESGTTFARHYIYRVRPDGRDLQLLTPQAGDIWSLQWSPDSEWLLFMGDYGRGWDIYRMRADGSSLQNLTPGPGQNFAPQYAPVTGRDWNPALMMFAALGMLLARSILSRTKRAGFIPPLQK